MVFDSLSYQDALQAYKPTRKVDSDDEDEDQDEEEAARQAARKPVPIRIRELSYGSTSRLPPLFTANDFPVCYNKA
jgi:hypothetical protein